MTLRGMWGVVIVGLSVASSVQAASFDCAQAATWSEKMICNDADLSTLDDTLAQTYNAALQGSKNKGSLQKAQQDWLMNVRDACLDMQCLTEAYTIRIQALKPKPAKVAAPAKPLDIAGDYKRYVGNDEDSNMATISVTALEDGQFEVSGDAIWQGEAEGAVNLGVLAGTFPLENNQLLYIDPEDAEGCSLKMTFSAKALVVSEDNGKCGGLNVSFNGSYRLEAEDTPTPEQPVDATEPAQTQPQ